MKAWLKGGWVNRIIFLIIAVVIQAVIIFIFISQKLSGSMQDFFIITGLILEFISLIIIIKLFSKRSLLIGFFIGSIFTSLVALFIYVPSKFRWWGAGFSDGAEIVPIAYFVFGILLCLILIAVFAIIRKIKSRKQLQQPKIQK